jgi:hypothetical protein
VAVNRVHHDPVAASFLCLPVRRDAPVAASPAGVSSPDGYYDVSAAAAMALRCGALRCDAERRSRLQDVPIVGLSTAPLRTPAPSPHGPGRLARSSI